MVVGCYIEGGVVGECFVGLGWVGLYCFSLGHVGLGHVVLGCTVLVWVMLGWAASWGWWEVPGWRMLHKHITATNAAQLSRLSCMSLCLVTSPCGGDAARWVTWLCFSMQAPVTYWVIPPPTPSPPRLPRSQHGSGRTGELRQKTEVISGFCCRQPARTAEGPELGDGVHGVHLPLSTTRLMLQGAWQTKVESPAWVSRAGGQQGEGDALFFHCMGQQCLLAGFVHSVRCLLCISSK